MKMVSRSQCYRETGIKWRYFCRALICYRDRIRRRLDVYHCFCGSGRVEPEIGVSCNRMLYLAKIIDYQLQPSLHLFKNGTCKSPSISFNPRRRFRISLFDPDCSGCLGACIARHPRLGSGCAWALPGSVAVERPAVIRTNQFATVDTPKT